MNTFVKESLLSLDTELAAIEVAVNRLSEEDIWKVLREETNSIGNLCLHLAGSEYGFIVSIVGGNPFIRQRSSEFTDSYVMNKQQLINRLQEVRRQSKEVLSQMNEEELIREVDIPASKNTVVPEPAKKQSCLSVIMKVVTHYAYHSGQIVYLTKLLQEGNQHVLKWRH